MILLAADTSSAAGSVALAANGRVASRDLDPALTCSETLLPAVASLLEECGLGQDSVEALAVGTGPGAFTGLRVGLATFKGWASAAGLPIAPVPSLWAWALPVLKDGVRALVLNDARKGELYTAAYSGLDDHGLPTSEKDPALLKPSELTEWCRDLESGSYRSVGSAMPLVAGIPGIPPPASDTAYSPSVPLAVSVLEAGQVLLSQGKTVTPSQLLPFYLRSPDAIPPSRNIVVDEPGH